MDDLPKEYAGRLSTRGGLIMELIVNGWTRIFLALAARTANRQTSGTPGMAKDSMSKSVAVSVLLVGLAAAGCMSQAKFLDSKQAMAEQTATNRGKFEMNCPAASGTVLSREVVQPVLQGPWVGPGILRAEYTVGVAGCGKRSTFVVICPEEGDGCFATGPGRFIRE
jgi:hypothetical protein